ncbi:OmpW/AlkL family protein [Halopseudomonas yangmingensis]|uniref:Outer membrane protein n=1 Tax=Halopseudomonas yangmingensis TaxID=1720063 RepID=A0A1I4SIP1_9GAMM|nr:OmpW family outer membrane protein [Halopseudomonas yangmingensis]SFM64325.1 outer membrane protein [Halopseudomonas yangmingensis]
MSKTIRTAAALLLAPALLASAISAQAHQAGDIIVRAGAVTVDPREDSSNLKLAGIGALPGTSATLDSNTQLGLNFVYMLSNNLGIEVLAATPFKHDVGVKGLGGLDGKLGSIKHLPPTVSAVWYPLDGNDAFKPYVGAGINYTTFFSEDLTSERKGQQFSGLSLDDSWGLAVQVGADYMITDKLMLNAQLRYVDISTTATTSLAGTRVKVDVDVDPWVYMVGLGYKF